MVNAPSIVAVASATANVMQAATFAAVELGNFPLQVCDVHCAFDNWILDEQKVPGRSALRMDYFDALIDEVRKNLAKLGYEF